MKQYGKQEQEVSMSEKNIDKKTKKNELVSKSDCDIVRDLIPLYVDEVTSHGSSELIERHIQKCNDCKKILETTREPLIKERETDTAVAYIKAFEVDKKRMKKMQRVDKIIFLAILCIAVFLLNLAYQHLILGDIYHVKVVIGASEKFQDGEISEAVKAAKNYFRDNYKYCKLILIEYDEEFSNGIEDNSSRKYDSGYRVRGSEDKIELIVKYRTRSYEKRLNHLSVWEADYEYSIHFTLYYFDDLQRWVVISAGVG